ncbi:hypothetical protein BUALT_Bualt04G0086300 [Buddleja alternifolia]|uniref:Uncharacterized protein n=1 Tax=Buddleja alternifolia TaxID=168488 RepID=A0AAV6XY46_9LAMI|nr:hypothetical protein BUALT_Bualt04G0086300 [Buddleja alternifolia]
MSLPMLEYIGGLRKLRKLMLADARMISSFPMRPANSVGDGGGHGGRFPGRRNNSAAKRLSGNSGDEAEFDDIEESRRRSSNTDCLCAGLKSRAGDSEEPAV